MHSRLLQGPAAAALVALLMAAGAPTVQAQDGPAR